MSTPTTVARLLTGTLLSATFGALFFVLSVFMSHESNVYVPAISIAIACAAAFVGFFVAYLVASTPKQ